MQNIIADSQNFELLGLEPRPPLLLPLLHCLGLPPALHQHRHPLRNPDHLRRSRPFRARLGHRAVQMLDQPIHHVRTVGVFAEPESILAVLRHQDCVQHGIQEHCGGC